MLAVGVLAVGGGGGDGGLGVVVPAGRLETGASSESDSESMYFMFGLTKYTTSEIGGKFKFNCMHHSNT